MKAKPRVIFGVNREHFKEKIYIFRGEWQAFCAVSSETPVVFTYLLHMIVPFLKKMMKEQLFATAFYKKII